MSKIRRNDPCPCGSGEKYKNCCLSIDYAKQRPQKKKVNLTLEDGSQISTSLTAIDSLPTRNQNGLSPDITPEQMMDLCLDEIEKVQAIESVGMAHDLIDRVVGDMDLIPTFTYREIAQRMAEDGRFEVVNFQICSLRGTDPIELMAEKLKL